jgi:hypothetical protein
MDADVAAQTFERARLGWRQASVAYRQATSGALALNMAWRRGEGGVAAYRRGGNDLAGGS